jgi:hypothetical protein
VRVIDEWDESIDGERRWDADQRLDDEEREQSLSLFKELSVTLTRLDKKQNVRSCPGLVNALLTVPDDGALESFFFFPNKDASNPVALTFVAEEDDFLVAWVPLAVLFPVLRKTVSPRAALRFLARRMSAALRHSRLPWAMSLGSRTMKPAIWSMTPCIADGGPGFP